MTNPIPLTTALVAFMFGLPDERQLQVEQIPQDPWTVVREVVALEMWGEPGAQLKANGIVEDLVGQSVYSAQYLAELIGEDGSPFCIAIRGGQWIPYYCNGCGGCYVPYAYYTQDGKEVHWGHFNGGWYPTDQRRVVATTDG